MDNSPDIFIETPNGNTLAARDHQGTGPDLLLIHGNSRTLLDWTPLLPTLLTQHRVVSMDLRGHGRSSTAPWTFEAVLEDLAAVIEHFGLKTPAVAGHSLGGMIAAMWGAEHPECPGTVNLDGHGMGRPDQYLGLAPELVEQRFAEMEELKAQMQASAPVVPVDKLEETVESFTAMISAQGVPCELAEASVRREIEIDPDTQMARFGYRAQDNSASIEALDLFAIYAATQCPLLVVNCNKAEVSPPGAPEWLGEFMGAFRLGLDRDLAKLAASNPKVSTVTLPLSHGLLFEDPEGVATLVNEFLA